MDIAKEYKRYKRGRTSAEFCQAAAAAGLTVDMQGYDMGGDWLRFHGSLHGTNVDAMFNVVNSRVVGTAGIVSFSTDMPIDGEPWFDAILGLANTNDERAAA